MNNLKFASHLLLKIRGFTAVAVLVFALGIGANAPAWAHPGAEFDAVVAALERVPGDSSRPVASRGASTFKGLTAGEEKQVGGIRLCWCPPGRFRMGSPPAEIGRREDEAQVEVTLTRGFWTGKFELTQGQWKREMGAIPGDLIAGKGDDFPVYWVNFLEAEDFCRRLTHRARTSGELPTGWEFRLPTEAQWEYACRAGTSTAFAFGESLTRTEANIGKPYDGTPDGTPGTAAVPVGSYAANKWGLHDMHGNEFEWCRDWYHARLPGGIDPDLRDTQGIPNRDGTYSRVRRGGAWMDGASFCRSAFRLRYEPPRRSDHIGFRIVAVEAGGQ
ncbi:MAG: SUMF1/EgtB/PvdO family nonheme iron enzyme [Verrucomicrobiales bacterium]|nr:SUMF1/EgtB/PvdO family nonheme iron enzyme [Verrucomicrobiales bacterium]